MRGRALRVAVTCGDPAGIGPEVALKAVHELNNPDILPVIIGRSSVVQTHYNALTGGMEFISPEKLQGIAPGGRYLCDISADFPLPTLGNGTPDTGEESLLYVDTALRLWQEGKVDALVTGPVSKSLIERSGTPFTGHTEYIADFLGEDDPFMMMYDRQYRVLLATTHLPLDRVREQVDRERLLKVFSVGYESIRSIDGAGKPITIAVTGLDPHCGDGGAICHFDDAVTSPAVEDARARGIPVEGPFAADTLFMPEKWRRYSLVVVHYHDQGLIPFKMVAFDRGVNVTLNLSITRTSVDHGTAFDIAGTDRASHTSMAEAIRVAAMLESKKNR